MKYPTHMLPRPITATFFVFVPTVSCTTTYYEKNICTAFDSTFRSLEEERGVTQMSRDVLETYRVIV